MATIPAGVTLQPIAGGSTYYANSGLTYAVNAGWDNPNFFPIGPWFDMLHTASDASRWGDLDWNTAFVLTDDSNLSLANSNGISLVLYSPLVSSANTHLVGLLSTDEPSTFQEGISTPISTTPNNIQDGRFWWVNNTLNLLEFGLNGAPPPGDSTVLTTSVATPNGTLRHIDVSSIDSYWFAGGRVDASSTLYLGGLLDNLGRDMTPDEAARGSNYGDVITQEIALTGGSQPVFAFVEDGGPFPADTQTSDYITPPELNWAVWSSLIHGARGIIYFNHTFGGPAQSDDNLAQPFYQTIQPGQTISMYDQVKATDALVEQMAPVLNSPIASGYVTVSPAPQLFSGVETSVHYNGTFYIFADTRDSETQTNIQATFTLKDPDATSVTVISEGRTIPVVNGSFSDKFATGATVHIYQVNEVSDTTIPAIAVELSMYGAVGSSAEITFLATQYLPPQVAVATVHGLNPIVYASEAVGLAFNSVNESGSTAFANQFGPSNSAMPNSVAGDAAFAAAAASVVFGSAATSNTTTAIQGWVSNWKAWYSANGLPWNAHPTTDQVDLAARGAAWGDAVGNELVSKAGPLYAQVTNFLQDAAQGTAVYSAPLTSKPTDNSTSGAATSPTSFTAGDASAQLVGVSQHVEQAF